MVKLYLCFLVVFSLISCSSSYNVKQYPLHNVVCEGKSSQIQPLIKAGAPIDARDSAGLTPLMVAVREGHWDAVKELIEMGADVNVTDRGGMTPLFYAIYGQRGEMVTFLADRGAKIEARNSGGNTPLMLAASYQYFEIVKTLAQRGAEINVQDSIGMTPLLHTVYACNQDGATFLIEHGAKTDARGENGASAVHYTVYGCSGSQEKASAILDKLLENGCDISAVNSEGHSAFWKAMEFRLVDMVALLRKKGVTERFNGGSPIELQKMAAEDCTYIVDGERSAGLHSWFIAGPISYGVALLKDSIKIPKKYRECMGKMGFNTIEQ